MALEVTQVRSSNGAKRNQLATLASLGLRRMRHTVVVPDRPEIRGMVATVNHLVAVREVADGTTLEAHAHRDLSAEDAGEPGSVGEAHGAHAEAVEVLEEQGLIGKGVDNPSDLVQHPRQKVPDDVTIKVPGNPLDAEAEAEAAELKAAKYAAGEADDATSDSDDEEQP